MNANEEPRNAGTFPFARKWNSSVPKPANRSVADTESPVSAGTSTVAPNMANICCRPNTPIFGTPSGRASYTASGLSLAPMVGTGRSLLIGKTPLVSLPARGAASRPRARANLRYYATRKARRTRQRGKASCFPVGRRTRRAASGRRHGTRSMAGQCGARHPAGQQAAPFPASGTVAHARRRACSPLSGSPSPFSRWSRRRRWRARAR